MMVFSALSKSSTSRAKCPDKEADPCLHTLRTDNSKLSCPYLAGTWNLRGTLNSEGYRKYVAFSLAQAWDRKNKVPLHLKCLKYPNVRISKAPVPTMWLHGSPGWGVFRNGPLGSQVALMKAIPSSEDHITQIVRWGLAYVGALGGLHFHWHIGFILSVYGKQ